MSYTAYTTVLTSQLRKSWLQNVFSSSTQSLKCHELESSSELFERRRKTTLEEAMNFFSPNVSRSSQTGSFQKQLLWLQTETA